VRLAAWRGVGAWHIHIFVVSVLRTVGAGRIIDV
jgi:hypothetical protein